MGRSGSLRLPPPFRQAHASSQKGLEIRSLEKRDKPALEEFYSRVSEESLRRRFMYMRRNMREEQIEKLLGTGRAGDLALVAFAIGDGAKKIAGIGQLFPAPDGRSAEFALLVRDDLQGNGIGSALLTALRAEARVRGIASLTASVLPENAAMLRIADKAGFENRGRIQDGVLSLRAALMPGLAGTGPAGANKPTFRK